MTLKAGCGRGFNSHPVHFYHSDKIRYYFEPVMESWRPSSGLLSYINYWNLSALMFIYHYTVSHSYAYRCCEECINVETVNLYINLASLS